jgi:hypothetical protein
MLKNSSDEISACYQNAEKCARQAAAQKTKARFFGHGAALAVLSAQLRVHGAAERLFQRDEAANG